MIAPHTFVAKWKGEPLLRVPSALLDGVNIPEISRRFLIEAGLPFRWKSVSFGNLAHGLPLLSDILSDDEGVRGYRILGTSAENWCRIPPDYLCIEEDTGRLVIRQSGFFGQPTSFWLLNSSISHFAASLLAYETFSAAFKQLCQLGDCKPAEELVDEFEQHLKRIDPDAMNEEAYWPVYLDRIWG
jgi:hypothetical protein